jgi:uncharacterized protein (TIRG00374 family)
MKRWMAGIGLLIGLGILSLMLWRLDWHVFAEAFRQVRLPWLAVALALALVGQALRALRWNIVSGRSFSQYSHFWRCAVIGQFCNFIYPLRAGDILRIMSLRKFANVPLGLAATSAVVDRVNDGFLLIVCLLVVLSLHGAGVIGVAGTAGIFGGFGLMILGATLFVVWGGRARGIVARISAKFSARWAGRINGSYENMLEVSGAFRRPGRVVGMAVVNILIVAADVGIIAVMFMTMGWELPLGAALTTIVFLWAGGALPSAPGFIGIFQIACVLALGLYGIEESSAFAFSVLLHLFSLFSAVAQGGVATLSYGINPRREYSRSLAQGDPARVGETWKSPVRRQNHLNCR